MTRSCRSRAIRSRSSYSHSRSASARLAASSSATPACAANEATTSAWTWGNGGAPWRRPTVSTPRTLPGAPSGNTIAAPIWLIAPRAARATRSSWAKSSEVDRLAAGQHPPGQRLIGRQHQAAGRVGAVAVRVADRHPAAFFVGQGQHGQVGAGQLPGPPGDVGQYLVGRGAGQQPGGDLGAGLYPALLAAGRLVQPGVLHRHAGRGAQRDKHRLVVLGELPAATLVGQVQVAEHLVTDPDRDAEETAHRRVPLREAGRRPVGGDVRQAQRPGVVDQQTQQAASLGPVVDPRDLVLGQADRDELGQALALADDAERTVRRVDQADRGLDDPPQRGLQVQARADGDHGLEQAAHPVPGRQHDLQPPCSSASSSSSFRLGSSSGRLAGPGSTSISFRRRCIVRISDPPRRRLRRKVLGTATLITPNGPW